MVRAMGTAIVNTPLNSPYSITVISGGRPPGGERVYDPNLIDLVRREQGEDDRRTAEELRRLAKAYPTVYGEYTGIPRQAVTYNAGFSMSGQPPQTIVYRGGPKGPDFIEVAPQSVQVYPLSAAFFHYIFNLHDGRYEYLGPYDL